MPTPVDLLVRVENPRRLKGANTPYHQFNFDYYDKLQSDSPTRVAGEFLNRLLNPHIGITIEAAYTAIDPLHRRDTHMFAVEGDLPTFATEILWWKNRAVDLVSLFNRAAIHAPEFRGSHSNTALKRLINIDPLQLHPYISAFNAETGVGAQQNEPTILRGIHAEPFVYKEGHTLKGEDPTRTIVTLRTQPAAMYLDERIKEIQQSDEEHLQKLLTEKAAVERELVGHQFRSANRLDGLQKSRAAFANTSQ